MVVALHNIAIHHQRRFTLSNHFKVGNVHYLRFDKDYITILKLET